MHIMVLTTEHVHCELCTNLCVLRDLVVGERADCTETSVLTDQSTCVCVTGRQVFWNICVYERVADREREKCFAILEFMRELLTRRTLF